MRARPERVLQAFEQLEHAANAGDNKTTDNRLEIMRDYTKIEAWRLADD